MNIRSIGIIGAVGVMAGCSSLTPTNDPVYLRLTDMEARLMRIERVVENESLIELATEISQLREETQNLRGELETLRFNVEGTAERERNLYVDLDSRLQALEQSRTAAAPAPGTGGSFSPSASAPQSSSTGAPVSLPAGNDQDAYNAAFALIQAREYERAANGFSQFLTAYPQSVLRDNAQYWLAETHYVRRDFATALDEFQQVLDEYPQSAKLPDALLKIGYCNFELQRWDEARQALMQVTQLYPDTTAARLAEQRLDRIAQEAG